MVADLLAVPALGETDLINDLFALADQILHLRFGLLLATAEAYGREAELALVGVVVFGQELDLFFSQLCFAQEVQVLLMEGHDLLVVGGGDHAVADLLQLVCEHFSLGAWHTDNLSLILSLRALKVTVRVFFFVADGHRLTDLS